MVWIEYLKSVGIATLSFHQPLLVVGFRNTHFYLFSGLFMWTPGVCRKCPKLYFSFVLGQIELVWANNSELLTTLSIAPFTKLNGNICERIFCTVLSRHAEQAVAAFEF